MILPDPIRAAIEAHSRFTFPEEACGLLAADDSGALRMAYCLTNRERSPHRFTIDPDEHYAAIRHAERNGWVVCGSFHSHPTSAPRPSAADRAGALDPEWIHVIAGPVEPGPLRISVYRLEQGQLVEAVA